MTTRPGSRLFACYDFMMLNKLRRCEVETFTMASATRKANSNKQPPHFTTFRGAMFMVFATHVVVTVKAEAVFANT